MTKIEELKKKVKDTINQQEINAWFDANVKSRDDWHDILQAAVDNEDNRILKIILEALDACKKVGIVKKDIVNELYENVFGKNKSKEDVVYKGTLLAVAIKNGKLAEDVINLLVKLGVNVNTKNIYYITQLRSEVRYGAIKEGITISNLETA